MGSIMSGGKEMSAAERSYPHLTQVLKYAHQQSARFPPQYDITSAINEFKALLEIKEEYAKIWEQDPTPPGQSTKMASTPEPLLSKGEASAMRASAGKKAGKEDALMAGDMLAAQTDIQMLIHDAGKEDDRETAKKEVATLKETIAWQEMKITELTNRLSMVVGKQMSQGNPEIADLSDTNRPTKLGEKFAELYDNEYCDAYEDWKPICGDKEKDTLHSLLRVVTCCYQFCKVVADEQLSLLINQLDTALCHPVHTDKGTQYKCTISFGTDVKRRHYVGSLKFAMEFRRSYAQDIEGAIKMMFNNLEVPRLFKMEAKALPKSMQNYINRCVEIVWLMTVQDPPMVIRCPEAGSPINKDVFKCYSKQGKVVDAVVWPAVYLNEGGSLISKGYVLPS